MLEDVYDVMVALLQHAARTGLAEHLVNEAVAVIEKADPKIADKKRAAEAAAEQEAKDRAEFEAFKRFQAGQAADRQASAQAPAAAPAAPPVVTS